MAGKGRKAPLLANMDIARVRDAFAYLTSLKDNYIVKEGGCIVGVRDAVKRFKDTGDDKWVLHILMSNLGYFANALGKVAARWGIDPNDYIPAVYEGLREAMKRANPEIVRLSYLSTGVYMYCRRVAQAEISEKKNEVKMDSLLWDWDDDVEQSVADLDGILAQQGIYEEPVCYDVSFDDEASCQGDY